MPNRPEAVSQPKEIRIRVEYSVKRSKEQFGQFWTRKSKILIKTPFINTRVRRFSTLDPKLDFREETEGNDIEPKLLILKHTEILL